MVVGGKNVVDVEVYLSERLVVSISVTNCVQILWKKDDNDGVDDMCGRSVDRIFRISVQR